MGIQNQNKTKVFRRVLRTCLESGKYDICITHDGGWSVLFVRLFPYSSG